MTRFLDSIVGDNRFKSIFGSIDYRSMIVIYRVTLVVWDKVLLTLIWGVPRLVGRYCSYLLPRQDGGTSQI